MRNFLLSPIVKLIIKMILKVKVTKEHLEASMWCGMDNGSKQINSNCAIALSVRDVFPKARVEMTEYYPFGERNLRPSHNGVEFIEMFDDLSCNPRKRLDLPETEIELELTDEIIEEATKHLDFHSIVNNTPHLQLIEQ